MSVFRRWRVGIVALCLVASSGCASSPAVVRDGLINCATGDVTRRARDLVVVALAILASPSDWVGALERWAEDTGRDVAACAIRLAAAEVTSPPAPRGVQGIAALPADVDPADRQVAERAAAFIDREGWRFR